MEMTRKEKKVNEKKTQETNKKTNLNQETPPTTNNKVDDNVIDH